MTLKSIPWAQALFSVAVLLSGPIHALAETSPSCPPEPVVWAQYELSDLSSGEPSSTTVTLVRGTGQVAYRYAATGITELWEQTPGEQLRLVRHFDEHHRGIEYQPVEIRGSHDWGTKKHLVSKALRDQLEPVDSSGSGCNRVEHYQGQREHQSFVLRWHTRYQVPEWFEVSDAHGDGKQRWDLVDVSTDPERIADIFEALSQYQTTDYADVGDNESDPFLMNMIHLGFVEHGGPGFYDAQGHRLSGGHSH